MGRFQTSIKAHTLLSIVSVVSVVSVVSIVCTCKWTHDTTVYTYVLVNGDLVNTAHGAQKIMYVIHK